MMFAAHSNFDRILTSSWAQVFVPITVSSAMVSVIFSTSKGYRFRNGSEISSKDKAQLPPSPNVDSSETKNTLEKTKSSNHATEVKIVT
jgi:hypothetical protein